jgi:tetratricopeptide (TPR) repeat protein
LDTLPLGGKVAAMYSLEQSPATSVSRFLLLAVATGLLAGHPALVAEAEGRDPPAELLLMLDHGSDGEQVAAAARTMLADHKRHPRAADAAEVLGDYHFARGEYRTAARHYETAAEASGQDSLRTHRLVCRGRALLAAGELDAAVGQFEQILRSAPGTAEAGLGLADAAALAGEEERAAGLYRAVIDHAPESELTPIALAQLIRVLDALGRGEEALEIARRLVEDYPRASEAAAVRERLRVDERASRGAADRSGDGEIGETPPTTPSDPPIPEALYTLQLGAFGSEANAQELALEINKLGLTDVRIEREVRGSRTFYRVRCGAYPDTESAEAEGKRLRDAHGLSYQVVAR